MSQTKLESQKVEINSSSEKIFKYLIDFNNFESLMPQQITNWKSTSEECTFTINGMATLGMKIIEKNPNSKILISSNGKVPFDFTLTVLLADTGADSCVGQINFDAELNPMIKMMVEKPLGNFINLLANKMKEIK